MSKVFRAKDSSKLNQSKLIALGKIVEAGHPAIVSLLEWAEKKEKDIYKEVQGLITNKDIPERIIHYTFGEARAVKKDLIEYLKFAAKEFLKHEREKKKKEK